MKRASRIIATTAAAWLISAVIGSELRADDAAPHKPGPRKAIVGSLMYNMYKEYPGLEKRLEELSGFIDQMAEQAKTQYPGRGLDIAALPEFAVNGNAKGSAAEVSLPLEGRVLDVMGAKARQHNCYITVPMYLVDDRAKGLYSNAVVLLDRKGQVVGTYRKVFPVAGRNGMLEDGVTAGTKVPVFDCDFGRVGFQICFDVFFDEGWETLGRKGAELVIFPSQTPTQNRPASHALRNNYYVLTSTWRTAASLVDPMGKLIREVTGEQVGMVVEQIDLDYVVLHWQQKLREGKAFTEKYGEKVGFRYSRAEDAGIFWSNDPGKPIREMVRELNLQYPADHLQRSREVITKLRPGPIE